MNFFECITAQTFAFMNFLVSEQQVLNLAYLEDDDDDAIFN